MTSHHHPDNQKSFWQQYKPLLIILLLCAIMALAHNINYFLYDSYMYYFMAYFFIFLSMFKFFDLHGFVEGFATYDLIAQRIALYGYCYPFIELFLGLGYLMQENIVLINWLTLIVMLISGISVIISLRSGRDIQCACLGTVLNVPLSSISVIENFGMGIMATVGLVIY